MSVSIPPTRGAPAQPAPHLRVIDRTEWRSWVTPKGLAAKPIHRWFVFPHSFTDELVKALLDEWHLGSTDRLLDPFVGAGTTLVAARERHISALGTDLSPLAAFVSNVKVRRYEPDHLAEVWNRLRTRIRWTSADGPDICPEFLRKALPSDVLRAFRAAKLAIQRSRLPKTERAFFMLALLSLISKYSRAVATGGWVSWVRKRIDSSSLPADLDDRVRLMIADTTTLNGGGRQYARRADVRRLPYPDGAFSAVITSPPYMNRHDYTRVFAPELMFAFLDWEGTRRLRYQSFHSHPESRPRRPDAHGYARPKALARMVDRVSDECGDPRVPRMIDGYFLDLYLALSEINRVCRDGARIAMVIGNVQYCGVQIPVDEITAEIGTQIGLECVQLIAARYRGNSAQQMGTYGRRPSRESVVILKKSSGIPGHKALISSGAPIPRFPALHPSDPPAIRAADKARVLPTMSDDGSRNTTSLDAEGN